jgi:hypothetical protein
MVAITSLDVLSRLLSQMAVTPFGIGQDYPA